MSFREKSAWAMAAVTAGAGAFYLWMLVSHWQATGAVAPVYVVVPFVLAMIVLSIVAQVILGVLSPKQAEAPSDERERLIGDRSGNLAGWVVSIGAVGGLIRYMTHDSGVELFHIVFQALVLGQVSEYVYQIYLHRRGF